MERIFAIGDIHGCFDMLDELVSVLPLNADRDRIVFIGDYIDRGPDSQDVVEFIIDLKRRLPNLICLMGNHEEMFLQYLERPDNEIRSLFFLNGGTATKQSYGYPCGDDDERITIPQHHHEFFKSLHRFYETDDYLFVHAGLKPAIPLNEQDLHDLLWIRNEFIYSSCDFGKTIVFGHTPFGRPFMGDRKIGIDTGAVYGGRLTCIELPSRKIHQV